MLHMRLTAMSRGAIFVAAGLKPVREEAPMSTATGSKRTKDKYEKPDTEAGFKGPVRWLLGPQLIASLKYVALYAAFKGKLDPRDWMHAQPILLNEQQRFNSREAASDEYWFDYFADTGDGQLAMYSIAYLCLSDLW